MDIDSQDPTLNEAMAQLAQMEAEVKPADTGLAAPDQLKPASGDTTAQPAADATDAPDPSTKPDAGVDTPAAAEPKSQEQKTPEPGSKFAKNQARLEGGWKTLNEQKAAFQKEQEAFKARQEELATKERELQEQTQKASQPKHPPEYYENNAVALEKRAEELEAAGQFDEADEMRVTAKLARKYAKELRDNPPKPAPTDDQKLEQFKAQQKEWWGKAAIDFPGVVKEGAPEQAALKALIKAEPGVLQDPKGMYYAARLVTAETAAASVPALTKELGELRAKVKDLSEKMAISGDGAASRLGGEIPYSQKSEQEQLAELTQIAQQIDARGY